MTTPQPNASFVGSVPENYDRHLGPLFFEPYAADLVARLALPSRPSTILELACGTGIVTRRFRSHLPSSASIVATDLNEPMLDVARRKLDGAPGVEWRQADATSLPFSAEMFDAVICQFGFMFFPDKPLAAREAFRVLRPGGQLLFNVWGSLAENPLGRIAHETLASFFPSDPPQFYLVPFGMHEIPSLRALLEDAGFLEITIETLSLQVVSPSAEHAAIGLVRGSPVFAAIQERGSAHPDAIVAAVAAALATQFGDHPLRVPMQARVISARRPR